MNKTPPEFWIQFGHDGLPDRIFRSKPIKFDHHVIEKLVPTESRREEIEAEIMRIVEYGRTRPHFDIQDSLREMAQFCDSNPYPGKVESLQCKVVSVPINDYDSIQDTLALSTQTAITEEMRRDLIWQVREKLAALKRGDG